MSLITAVSYSFPRCKRLTQRREFSRVFSQGKYLQHGCFTLIIAPGEKQARLGLVVGRKAAPRAVLRNRLRRLARERFRQAGLSAVDVVMLVRPGAWKIDKNLLETQLKAVFLALKEQCAKYSSE